MCAGKGEITVTLPETAIEVTQIPEAAIEVAQVPGQGENRSIMSI